jgi:hypothetical protein
VKRVWLAILIGALMIRMLIGFLSTAAGEWFPQLAALVAVCTAFAGILAGRHGVFVGFSVVVVAFVIVETPFAIEIIRSGALEREFPSCDPCGIRGIGGRFVIIAIFALSSFGLIGTFAGWLGERGFRRLRILRRGSEDDLSL